jgi:hypothetical protein
MRRRVLAATSSATLAYLLLAATAFAKDASDGGQGLVGETTDKGVTFTAFGVILGFVLLVTLLSIAQRKLEKRKEERKATALHRRIGW